MKGLIIILGIIFCLVETAFCTSPLTIYYLDRVPYFYCDKNGDYRGLVMEPVIMAFEKAKVPYVLKEMPAKRILAYLKENRPNICSIGWYKNPEREKFAKYSIPIYQNKSRIAITSADNKRIPSGKTLEHVFKIPDLTLLLKSGYSYGKFIDGNIKLFKPTIYSTTLESSQMLKMILMGNMNYFFLSEEEADALIPAAGYEKSQFKYIHFSNIPVGLKRYIIFSKKVDDSIINKINTAISEHIQLNSQ